MADKGRTKEKKARRETIWVNVRKCCGCKREFLPAVSPDDQYCLVSAESDWLWDKQSMKWPLQNILSVLSNATPVAGQYKMQTADWV